MFKSHFTSAVIRHIYLTSNVDLKWPLNFMKNNRNYLLTKYYQATYQIWSSSNIYFLRYRVYKAFILLPLVTSNDLWPSWKTIGIIYSPRVTNMLSLKLRQPLLLEILCLQGFRTLTTGDLKWPLTSMKNNRDHLLTKGYQRTKFEVQATFNSWDIMFTRFQGFDLWWPLVTFDLHEKQ